jgi:hypothetical protein
LFSNPCPLPSPLLQSFFSVCVSTADRLLNGWLVNILLYFHFTPNISVYSLVFVLHIIKMMRVK